MPHFIDQKNQVMIIHIETRQSCIYIYINILQWCNQKPFCFDIDEEYTLLKTLIIIIIARYEVSYHLPTLCV